MTEVEREAGLAEWLKTRPECVQQLAAEFPVGRRYVVDGKPLHLLGYTEDDSLILTPIDPTEDYDGAMAARVHVCAKHFRDGENP